MVAKIWYFNISSLAMCFRRILQKMGQFRTYNDISLAKRLVRAQQDLTELKTSQLYLMQSTKGFEIPTTGKYNFVNTTINGLNVCQ